MRYQLERGDENNIAGKNSYARGENSSVDGKHISDFIGKQWGDYILELSSGSADMSHCARAVQLGAEQHDKAASFTRKIRHRFCPT